MKTNKVFSAIYLAVMIVTIVTVDTVYFQHHTEIRLFGNIGMVAIFLIGYLIISRSVFGKK